MVSIPSCHDGYPGSIPGRRAPFFLLPLLSSFSCPFRVLFTSFHVLFLSCSSHSFLVLGVSNALAGLIAAKSSPTGPNHITSRRHGEFRNETSTTGRKRGSKRMKKVIVVSATVQHNYHSVAITAPPTDISGVCVLCLHMA